MLIIDIKLKYDTITTGDGASAATAKPATESNKMDTSSDSKSAATGSVFQYRRIAVEHVMASQMLSQSTGVSRDYTHREMDKDVASLVQCCARGAIPSATGGSNGLTALATSRFMHKLFRIREKERLMDKWFIASQNSSHGSSGVGVGDPLLSVMSDSLGGTGSAGSSGSYSVAGMALDRLRRMFGDSESALDALTAVQPRPIIRCKRVLEGLLGVFLELPASASSPALLPSLPSISILDNGSVWFGLTYVGPCEQFTSGPIAAPAATASIARSASQQGNTFGLPPTPTDDISMSLDGEKQRTC